MKNYSLYIYLIVSFCLIEVNVAQKVAIVAANTQEANRELRRAHWANGGEGYPPLIGATVKLIDLEKQTAFSIRVGENVGGFFFEKGKKLLTVSMNKEGNGVSVSNYNCDNGEKISSYNIPNLRKRGYIPGFNDIANWEPPVRFQPVDLVCLDGNNLFAMICNSSMNEELAPYEENVVLVVFNEQKVLHRESIRVPNYRSSRILRLSKNKGLIALTQFVKTGSGNELEFRSFIIDSDLKVTVDGDVNEFGIGVYNVDKEGRLIFLNPSEKIKRLEYNKKILEKIPQLDHNLIKEDSKLCISILPVGETDNYLRVIQQIPKHHPIFGELPGGKKAVEVELWKIGDLKPTRFLELNESVVSVKLNSESNRLLVLSQKSPQLQIISIENFKIIKTIEHIIEKPTDVIAR